MSPSLTVCTTKDNRHAPLWLQHSRDLILHYHSRPVLGGRPGPVVMRAEISLSLTRCSTLKSDPEGVKARKTAMSLAGTVLSSPWWSGWGRIGRLTNQFQPFRPGLSWPTPTSIYDLLEYVKGPVIKIQSCRPSTTQDNNKISKRSPGEGPVSVV